ncbi:MAG: ATPase [Synergistaceae bacterium]|nr:V-type ATP synthase subunit E [Synergistota bacterium]NLM71020.1 ATPase [Synergistaceae bacterium]
MTEISTSAGKSYELGNPEKLSSLKSLLLKHGDEEGDAILETARREAASMFEERSAEVERLVEQIHSEAVRRAEEIAKRQIAGAEAARGKERLRLQNSLLDEAIMMLQHELTALRYHENYIDILAGLAVSAASGLQPGSVIKLSVAAEDAHLGREVVRRAAALLPGPKFEYNPAPAAITGGVLLEAPDGSWRSRADWHNVSMEMKEALAERLLAAL